MKKVIIPQIDFNQNVIGTTEVLIKDKPDTADYNKVVNILPGFPMGYCEEIYNTIGKIEITRFYDPRQIAYKKLKGLFLEIQQQ